MSSSSSSSSSSSLRLAFEALVVGAVLALALALVSWVHPASFRGVLPTVLTGLAVGAAVHVGFEAAGINRAYCSSGHACRQA